MSVLDFTDMAMQAEERLRQCNPDDPAFTGDEPYRVSPSDFFEAVEIADALVWDTPLGEEIDFDGIVLTED